MKVISATIVTLFSISSLAHATVSDSGPLDRYHQKDPNATPYQILEDVFSRSGPAHFSDFHSPISFPEFPSGDLYLNCIENVKADTTYEQLKARSDAPYHMTATTVTRPATPEVPGQGPLFPGKPEAPEETANVDFIAWATKDLNRDAEGVRQMARSFVADTGIVATETPTALVQTFTNGYPVEHYRIKDGMIIVRVDTGENTAQMYTYCWPNQVRPAPGPSHEHRRGD